MRRPVVVLRAWVPLLLGPALALPAGAAESAAPFAPAAAPAADATPAGQGLHGVLGLGVMSRPAYAGASERLTQGLPLIDVSYRRGGFEASTRGGLRYWLREDAQWRVALGLGIDGGRLDHRESGLLGAGSDRLKGMGRLKAAPELALAASYLGLGLPLNLELRAAPRGEGHGGVHGKLGLEWPLLEQGRWSLAAEAGLGFGDQRYLQAYHGVSAEQAARTGFAAFRPRGGLYQAELGLAAQYRVDERWAVVTQVGVQRLLGDAARSPLTERRTAPQASISLGYLF